MVRAECADALGRIKSKEAMAALVASAGIAHPKVRRAVAAALARFKTREAFEALRPHAEKDESYLVEAESARALGKTKQSAAFDTLVEAAARKSWADVVAAGAIDGLAAMRDERALPHLLDWTKYGHPTRVRRAAIMAIPKIDESRKTREALEELLGDADPHLRIDVARALAEIGDTKSRGPLRERLELDLDPRVRRRLRETLRDLGGDSKKVVDQLKEDFEKLQGEHASLKARVAQLEARAPTKDVGPKAAPTKRAAAPKRTKAKKKAKR
jgi:aminopeptidase N